MNKTSKDIRELISKAIDIDKIVEVLNQISNPTDYINAVSKLLPYVAGKVKPVEPIKEEKNPITIQIVPFEKD